MLLGFPLEGGSGTLSCKKDPGPSAQGSGPCRALRGGPRGPSRARCAPAETVGQTGVPACSDSVQRGDRRVRTWGAHTTLPPPPVPGGPGTPASPWLTFPAAFRSPLLCITHHQASGPGPRY